MGSVQVYNRNLATIRKRSQQLADALSELPASAEKNGLGGAFEELATRDGQLVLREDGVLLGSAYDSIRDAEQLATNMSKEPADLMIAIGFGMGTQFERYLEKNPGTLIIYEPSLTRLRAALHQTSIVKLFEKHRDCYITYDLDQFTRILDVRYASGLRIQVFPHPALLRLDVKRVSAAVERAQRVKEASDTRILTSVDRLMPWAAIVAHNGRRIAESTQISDLKNAFDGKVAVVCAAGPSLDKQLPLLRQYRDRVVVIAIGQTLKALRAAGISPDLVHILESQDVAHQLTESGGTADLCVALSPDCHPAVFDVPTRACFTASVSSSPFGHWIAKVTGHSTIRVGGGTVAQGAVGIASILGVKSIALIGQDLAFTDGRAYAKGSAYDFVGVDISKDGKAMMTNMKQKGDLDPTLDHAKVPDEYQMGDVVWVDSWDEGERVPTWRVYASFIEQYRSVGDMLGQLGIELINCTEGGARIPQVVHRPFLEVLQDEEEGACATAREQIVRCFDDSPRRTLEAYAEAIGKCRALLSDVEEEVEKAKRFAEKKRGALESAQHDSQRVKILRGIARYEKRIRTRLERMPWLDALVQPEIYNLIAATRRTERLEPKLEDLFDEALFLIKAAGNGVSRSREWFDAFEASFEVPRPTGANAHPLPLEKPSPVSPLPAGFLSPPS